MKPQNMHITLSFLGDLHSHEIENAKKILEEISADFFSFDVRLDKIRQERDMLWIMPSYTEAIESLQEAVKDRLGHARLGKRERRSYHPHILLGKSKTGRFMKWRPENFEPIEFQVNSISLYESELTPGVATHRLIHSFNFEKPLL